MSTSKVLTGASARAGTYYYHETRDLSTISQDCKNGCVYTKEGQGNFCYPGASREGCVVHSSLRCFPMVTSQVTIYQVANS